MLHTVLFYVFSVVLIGSALMVVGARNPVHAVLFLVLCFFNAAGLFLLLGAEFLAFILMIVYVGAVAVLFLFVVMMLDIDFNELRRGFMRYMPIGAAVGLLLLIELIVAVSTWVFAPGMEVSQVAAKTDNVHALGRVLYTDYFYPFQVSGLILLVAMIGAIVLTLRHKKDARRQKLSQQLNRPIGDVLDVQKVQPNQGVDI